MNTTSPTVADIQAQTDLFAAALRAAAGAGRVRNNLWFCDESARELSTESMYEAFVETARLLEEADPTVAADAATYVDRLVHTLNHEGCRVLAQPDMTPAELRLTAVKPVCCGTGPNRAARRAAARR